MPYLLRWGESKEGKKIIQAQTLMLKQSTEKCTRGSCSPSWNYVLTNCIVHGGSGSFTLACGGTHTHINAHVMAGLATNCKRIFLSLPSSEGPCVFFSPKILGILQPRERSSCGMRVSPAQGKWEEETLPLDSSRCRNTSLFNRSQESDPEAVPLCCYTVKASVEPGDGVASEVITLKA